MTDDHLNQAAPLTGTAPTRSVESDLVDYDVARLHQAALPYDAALVKAAGEQAANNLADAYARDLDRLGTDYAVRRRAASILDNVQRATLALADAHSGCRRKNCRVCDQIKILLVEMVAYRTRTV